MFRALTLKLDWEMTGTKRYGLKNLYAIGLSHVFKEGRRGASYVLYFLNGAAVG